MGEGVKDGGPAFSRITEIEAPNTIGHGAPKWSRVIGEGGMSLRDFFAAQCIMGSIALSLNSDEVAKQAYALADAMIAERDK